MDVPIFSIVSNKMNEVMKVLTIIATIFMPLTFIAGIYGMNFKYMPELEWRLGYFGVWMVMVVIISGMIIYFRKKGGCKGVICYVSWGFSLPPKWLRSSQPVMIPTASTKKIIMERDIDAFQNKNRISTTETFCTMKMTIRPTRTRVKISL